MNIVVEYSIMILKTILFYFVIVISLRAMGKREVGEVSVFDVVVFLVISELLTVSINDAQVSIFKSLIPITVLILLQILTSWVTMKSKKSRDLVEGKYSFIIEKGIINIKEMRKQRYTIDDLLMQLRDKDIDDLNQVEFAILENSGVLNVIKKSSTLKYPTPLIMDGEFQNEVGKKVDINKNSFQNYLKSNFNKGIKDIFICMVLKEGYYIVWYKQ